MQHRIWIPGVFVLVLGCAGTQDKAPAQGADATPRVRCRTELQYTPGPLGTGQSTPVQICEPVEVPSLPPGAVPSPGGTPAPSTQTVPAPKRDTPPAGD
jgi:hypothetical protein